ncbi:MAG: hypothetical protein GX643_18700, partial [Acidimicrobiales bacterium]|nr:hypothetical protein [Acidimicrobiales bacterium]
MQVLLLSLGTVLLAVAGIVFTAMNWSQMDATTQGGVLVALTAAVAAATAVTARKGLPATAEALGLVSVVLALVDAHALRISFWPDLALTAYWAPALAAVTSFAWWLATATGIRSTALAAVVMAQGPLFLVLDAVGADPTLAGLSLLAQVALVLVVTAPRLGSGRSIDGPTRGFALVPAAWTWTIVSAGSISELLAEGARSNPGAVAVVAAAATVAAVCAALWAHEDGMRTLALVVATLLGTAAGGWAIRLVADEATSLALVGLLTAAVAAVGLRTPARWGETPALAASWSAGLVACALLAPLERVLDRLTWVASQTWSLAASESATAPATTTDPAYAAPAVVALHLVGVAALILAWRPRTDRQHLTLAALGTWFGAVVLAPEMLPLSIGGAAALAWMSAVVAVGGVEVGLRSVAGDEGRAQRLLTTGGAVATAFLGLAAMWSLGARPSSLVTGAAVVAAAVWVLARGWWVQSLGIARLATGVAVVAVAVEAAMVAATLGASTATAWAIAGAAGLAASTLALLVLPGRLSEAGELAGWSLHGLSVLVVVSIADTMASSTAGTDIAGPADLGVAAAWRIVLLSGVVAAGARTPRGPSLRFASLA